MELLRIGTLTLGHMRDGMNSLILLRRKGKTLMFAIALFNSSLNQLTVAIQLKAKAFSKFSRYTVGTNHHLRDAFQEGLR